MKNIFYFVVELFGNVKTYSDIRSVKPIKTKTMKLDQFSLVFEVEFKDFKNHHISYCMNYLMKTNNQQRIKLLNDKIRFLNETGFRRLVLSEKSKHNLENYMIPKDIRIDVLRSLPNRKDIVLIDELTCVQYMKTDTELFVSVHERKEQVTKLNPNSLDYMFYFHIDLLTGHITMDNIDNKTKTEVTPEQMIEEYYSKFLVVVTYLELTDVTYNIILGGQTKGDFMKNNHIKNRSKQSVIQVNTNWNVETIRLGSFDVRGHWRLQGCGHNRMTFKFVWVKPYKKGLIRRLPQKESISQSQLN